MPAGTCRVERRSHSRGRRRRRREESRNARLAGLCGRLGQRDGGPGAPVPCWPRVSGASSTAAGCQCGHETRSCRGAAASPGGVSPGAAVWSRCESVLLDCSLQSFPKAWYRASRRSFTRHSVVLRGDAADRWTLLVIESCGRQGLVCCRSEALGGAVEPLRQRLRVGREFGIPDDLAVSRGRVSRRRASPDVAVVVAWRACVATRSCPGVEQLQRRLHTAGEELVGQVAVRQRPRELHGADHQSEDRERVGLRSLGVGWV
jgi:hypothetical protein